MNPFEKDWSEKPEPKKNTDEPKFQSQQGGTLQGNDVLDAMPIVIKNGDNCIVGNDRMVIRPADFEVEVRVPGSLVLPVDKFETLELTETWSPVSLTRGDLSLPDEPATFDLNIQLKGLSGKEVDHLRRQLEDSGYKI